MSEKLRRQFACSKMMLPEHCTMLREQALAEYRAENNRVPETDDQLRAEQQYILEDARAGGKTVIIKTPGNSGYNHYAGTPLRYDSASGRILIRTVTGDGLEVPAAEVISIRLAD